MNPLAPPAQNDRVGFTEEAIGITKRLCGSDFSWSGILRKRYTDFLVNEIQRDGTVLHLTDFEPVEVTHVKRNQQREAPSTAAPSATAPTTGESAPAVTESAPEEIVIPPIAEGDREILTNLLGAEHAEGFLDLYKKSFEPGVFTGKRGPSATTLPLEEKEKRTAVHQEVRRIFNSALETSTDEAGGIIATLAPRRGGGRRDNRNARGNNNNNTRNQEIGRRGDPNSGGKNYHREIQCPGDGEYLHFNLYKMNRDTMEAAAQIAKQLSLKPQNIQYAGTKDRRGVTVQRCSVRRRKPHELDRLNSRLYDICIGDFSYADEPVHLGMLAGNEFTITLKGCTFPGSESLSVDEQVEKLSTSVTSALDHMHSHGWLNYFGHQRFGTFNIGTHEIGQLILSGAMKEACHALLSYDEKLASLTDQRKLPAERSLRDEATRSWCCRTFLRDGDAGKALDKLPRRYNAEGTIIRHLSQRPTDYMGALLRVTRGLRSMYLHAYQSYVWNFAASHRWELYGGQVVVGDLVRDDKTAAAPTGTMEVDQDGEEIVTAETSEEDADAFTTAHIVTEADIQAGTYTIFDVVLPTPGHSTLLPTNAMGDFYKSFMQEHGGIDVTNMARGQKEFSLSGRYRPMMARFMHAPEGWVKACADELEQLAKTDLDIVKERVAERKAKEAAEAAEAATTATEKDESEGESGKKRARSISDAGDSEAKKARIEGEADGAVTQEQAAVKDEAVEKKSIAVVVKFQLAKSSYATVVLRELMGAPTTQ